MTFCSAVGTCDLCGADFDTALDEIDLDTINIEGYTYVSCFNFNCGNEIKVNKNHIFDWGDKYND